MKNRPDHFDASRTGFITWKGYSMPFAMALAAASGQAATLTWDSDANFANGSTDGLGTWNTALLNWNNGAADVIWPNSTGDTAVFGAGGTAGLVTVDGTVNVGAITFNSGMTGTYTLTGGTLNGLGTINLAAGSSSRIDSTITRSGDLNIVGTNPYPELTLGGATSNTGNLRVYNGANVTLAKTGGAIASSGNVQIGHDANYAPNGILSLAQSEQIADTAIVAMYTAHYGGACYFQLMGNNETIGGLYGQARWSTGAIRVRNGAATDSTLTLNVATGTTQTFGVLLNDYGKALTVEDGAAGKLHLIKDGLGTQVFQTGSVNMAYTGTTTINAGVLSLRSLNFNNSPTVLAGGTLNVQGSTVNASIGGSSGGVTVTGGTTSNFGGANKTYTGDTILSAASTTLTQTAANSLSANSIHDIGTGSTLNTGNFAGSVKALTGAGTVNLNGAAANLTVTDGSGQTFSGTVTGTGMLSKSGAGTQTLTGSVLHTGGTTINGGVLQIGGTATLNGGSSSGNITNTGTLQFSSSANQTLSGNISGVGGALVKDTGAGTLTLGGNNSYSGGTVISSGTVLATNGSALGSAGGLTLSGGHLTYKPSAAGALNVGSGVLNFADGSRVGTVIGGTVSQSAITSSAAAVTTGTITIDISGISNVAATLGVNNLITAGGGLDGAAYTLGNIYNATNFTIVPGSLAWSPTAVSVDVAALAELTDAWWKGGFAGGNNVWSLSNGVSDSNWAKDAVGTATHQVPGASTLAHFSATGAVNQSSMVLGADMSIKGVVISDPGTVGLDSDAYTLTLGSGGLVMDTGSGFAAIGARVNFASGGVVSNTGSGTLNLNGTFNMGAGGITANAGAGTININGPVTLTATQAWTNDSSNAMIIGGSVATAGFTLSAGGTGDFAINGAVSGAGTLVKTGSGTASLSGPNTVSVVRVDGGTLALAGVNTLAGSTLDTGASGAQQVTWGVAGNNTYNLGGLQGSDELEIADNTIRVGAGNANSNFAGVLAGGFGGNLAKAGTGTFTLSGSGSNTFPGSVTVTQGVLALAKTGGAVAMGGTDLRLDNNLSPDVYTLVNNQFAPDTVVSFVTDSGDHGRLDLMGTTQTLAGIQTVGYTGIRGVIQNSEAVANSGTSTLILNGTGSYTYTGYLRSQTGVLGLVKNGSGTQTLSHNQISYTGATIINEGTLNFNGGDSGNFNSPITMNGGILSHSGTGWRTMAQPITIAAPATIHVTNTGNNNQLFFDGGSAGSGTLTINNTGSATTGVYFRGGAGNTRSGATIVNGGFIGFGTATGPSSLANSDLTLNGAKLELADGQFDGAVDNTAGVTVKSLSGNGTVSGSNRAATLTMGTNNGTGSFSGVISNGGGVTTVVKTGNGTQTFTGANTYTGATTVNGGVLQLDFSAGGAPASDILASGGVLNLGGGTLALMGASAGASSQTLGNLNLSANSGITIGNAGANTILTFAALGTRSPGAGLAVDLATGAGANTLTFTSVAAFPAAGVAIGWTTVTDAGGTGFGTISGNNLVRYIPTFHELRSDSHEATWDFNTTPTDTDYVAGLLTMNAGAHDLNSLTIDSGAGGTIDLNGTTLTFATGGVIMNGAGNFAVNNGQFGATGAETSITVAGAGSLTLGATVGGAGSSLGKGGSGTLILTGDNSAGYGVTNISAGTLQVGAGGASGTLGTGAVTNNGTLSFRRTDEITVGNAIGGIGNLVKEEANTLILTGANTYAGTTAINGGTLQIGNGGTTGALGGGSVTNNGSLVYNRSDDGTLGMEIGGTGALTKLGAGMLILTRDNTYGGGTTITTGTLSLGNNTVSGSVVGPITNNGTLRLNRSGASTFGNNVTGTGTLATFNDVTLSGNTINLTGTLRVSGNGRLTIQDGVTATFGDAWLNSNSVGGTATTVITGGFLTVTGEARDNRDAYFHVVQSGGQVSFGGLYTGRTDSGNEGGFGGNSTYTLTGGTFTTRAIQGGGGGGWWDRGITMNLGGGTLRAGATFTMNANTVNLTGVNGNATVDTNGFNITSNYGFSGVGGLIKTGDGILQLNGISPYAGGTTITGGTLRLGHATNTLADTGAIVVDGVTASLAIGGSSDVVGAVTLRNGSITGASGTLIGTGFAVESGVVSAILGGVDASLTKTTPGKVLLSGANTYSGPTQVDEGTLIVDGSTVMTGMITVASGATLGGGGMGGHVTLVDGAILAPGSEDRGNSNQFNLTSLALSGLSILQFELDYPLIDPQSTTPAFNDDYVMLNQTLTLDGRLQITALEGFGTPELGNRWLLMGYPVGTMALADRTLEVDLANSPSLTPGLTYWVDTTKDGYIYLEVVVPEAGTAGLVAMGLLLLRRRIRR